ncbi:MAG TPA: GNAT family N-acetyltransferase [Salinimicrobium sp.]|nr:GNAT family N-acetyltransferase [Salinimicrobium sp.]
MSEIRQKENEGKGMFYIEHDGRIVAELTYTKQDNGILTLDHTETDPEMKGQGLAGKLVKHSVEFARQNNLKIDPLCEYASAQFERHEEYQEVQAK